MLTLAVNVELVEREEEQSVICIGGGQGKGKRSRY